ncbi:RimK/LysX family protein [Flammeovirga sp. EKP202]|uniref:ATP-dependent zinc protease family protein n=1 Tax=Flammeovirga sp. EKP202 TaxID=2770592 RepID=UPI001CB85E5F|nr:RimK/LysX family protein [Flammeovirga sp. EKP202]
MEIIGRTDLLDFPELNLENLDVKIDTGAYTSSIHCHEIHEININGTKYLRFKVLDDTYPKYQDQIITVRNYKSKKVRSSFGDIEERFVIRTQVILFNKEYPIELSLSDRSEMRFPVLIGRKFLNKNFIVDPSTKNMSSRSKNSIEINQ